MPETIAGREEEKNELANAFNSSKAEFIVIYGRRRIGKTFLVEQVFKKKACHFFHVTGIQHGSRQEQLREFSKVISSEFYQGAPLSTADSWIEALEILWKAIQNASKNKKVVLFFDEFPWMCTQKSGLLQALDYYWNRFWKNDKRIKLILCGSSASWIIRKVLHHKGGLHNRYTRAILLKPFTLRETKQFFKNSGFRLEHEQILQIYMVCGGVPYYLNYIPKGKPAAKIFDKICFQETGVLYNEFDRLFESLFDDAAIYKELVSLIATSREGISRSYLEEKSVFASKGGTLSERLKDLEETAFIKAFLPLRHKRQGNYYRIIDEYSYFYLKWIAPIKNTLIAQEINNKFWSSKLNTPAYYNWLGYAFEAICYKHIAEIRKALDISPAASVGVWRYVPRRKSEERGAQIDMIFENPDNTAVLCEIKYTDKPFVIDKNYAENLREKIRIYQQQTKLKSQIYLALISSKGIKKNHYSEEMVDQIVTLEDLF